MFWIYSLALYLKFVSFVCQNNLLVFPFFSLIFWTGSWNIHLKCYFINLMVIMVQIQIYIMHLTGKKTLLRVKNSDTVINVKKMILDKDDIELHQQRLIFDNKQLEDNLTLEYYNVQDKSAIELVLRLCRS
jgi:hypothetical protein